jgi:hypothetical protein
MKSQSTTEGSTKNKEQQRQERWDNKTSGRKEPSRIAKNYR